MRTLLVIICAMWAVLVVSGSGLCQESALDSRLDRLEEKREAFGMGIREESVQNAPVEADERPVIVPVVEPQPETEPKQVESDASTAPEPEATETPEVVVREVTQPRPSHSERSVSKDVSAKQKDQQPAEESEAVAEDADVGKQSHRPDKIALLAQMNEEGQTPARAGGDTAVTVFGTIWRLALVCGLAYLVLLALKCLYNKRDVIPHGTRDLRMVDTVRLSPSSSLHLLDVRGKKLLIGCSSGQVNLLQELEETAAEEPEVRASNKFAEYLEKYSAGEKTDNPARRIAGLLRDCTSYLKQRATGTGDRDEG